METKQPQRSWVRSIAKAALVAAALFMLLYEWGAEAKLSKAMTAADHAAIAATAMEYPFSTAVIRARAATAALPAPGLDLRSQLHPLRVDWLPLFGWPAAAAALMVVCLTRLGRWNQWSVAALGMSAVAALGAMIIWGVYGFPAGGWLVPMIDRFEPAVRHTGWLYAATWALLLLAAWMQFCPLRKPKSDKPAAAKIRPHSPTDPRAALAYLTAQKQEGRYSKAEYTRRREAILEQI